MSTTSKDEERLLICGGGPAGLSIAIQYKIRHPNAEVRIVTAPDLSIHPKRYFEAHPWAAGLGQPYQSNDGAQAAKWFKQTTDVMRGLSEFSKQLHWGVVHSLHQDNAEFRPEWAHEIPTTTLSGKQLANGYRSGFAFETFILNPQIRHAYLVQQAFSLGIRIYNRLLFDIDDIRELNAEYSPTTIIDALGISSGLIFKDDLLAGRIGHIVTYPNSTGDRLSVMDDANLRYVITGPDNYFFGGTYIDVEVAAIPYADYHLTSEFEERAMDSVRMLRPDLWRRIRPADLSHQVGVRPYRPHVRTEFEDIDGLPPVLHVTGLGGSGWSICHGVANTAINMIDDYREDFSDEPIAELDSEGTEPSAGPTGTTE